MPHRLSGESANRRKDQKACMGSTLSSSHGLAPNGAAAQWHSIKRKTSVPDAVCVMTQYFEALNARDLKRMAELCQFPFVSFEQVTPVVVKSADDLISEAPPSMNMSEHPDRWTGHDSFVTHGSYDTLHGIEILAQDPYAANLAMVYNRYGADGKMLLQSQGVYCLTCNEGKWGIELMSTIFTPAPLVGWHYPESEEAGLRTRTSHDVGPNTDDSEAVGNDYQYGPQAGVSGSDCYIPLQKNADRGEAIKTYGTIGVESRLHDGDGYPSEIKSDAALNIRESGDDLNNPAAAAKYKDDWHWYRAMYDQIGPSARGFTIGLMPYSRVIHATDDKAHVFSGLTRFNTVGEEIDTNSEMSIITWWRGRGGRRAPAHVLPSTIQPTMLQS